MEQTRQALAKDEEVQLARELYLACQQRGFRLDPPDASTIVVGPALVAVSMSLEAGSSIRPIESVLDDLSREVGVSSISVENDPERPFHVRFLIARRHRQFPALPSDVAPLIEPASQSYLGLFIGQTLSGNDYTSFVSGWPHMLIGGTTGSGKTTFIRSILRQVERVPPTLIKLVIVDGKGEVDYINLIPQDFFVSEFPEVLLGHQQATTVLDWIVDNEIPRRRAAMLQLAKSAGGARPKSARELFVASASEREVRPFSLLLVVIDEFAEIMLAGGATAQRFEQRVQQITQVGRSTLVHLVLATQRPDATVVRGPIKANLDARIALRLPTHHDSMTILGGRGAERLLGSGDLIFQAAGQPPQRLQGYNA